MHDPYKRLPRVTKPLSHGGGASKLPIFGPLRTPILTEFAAVTQLENRRVFTFEHVHETEGAQNHRPKFLGPATYQCFFNRCHIAQCATNCVCVCSYTVFASI